MAKLEDVYKAMLLAATYRDWEVFPTRGGVAVRELRRHPTPPDVREAGWWPGATYSSVRWVTVIGRKVSIVRADTFWTENQESVSSNEAAIAELSGVGHICRLSETCESCKGKGGL